MLTMLSTVLLAVAGQAVHPDPFETPASLFSQDDGSFRAAPGAPHALETTAAFAWSLVGSGQTSELEALGRAVDWIVDELEAAKKSEPARLLPGEALATAMLTDLGRIDQEPPVPAVAALHVQRLLSVQAEDGAWPIAGAKPDAPKRIEAAGWAAWVLRKKATPYEGAARNEVAWPAYLKAKAFLASKKDSHMAVAFTLYFDAVDTADRTAEQHARFAAAVTALEGGPLQEPSASPQLLFVMTCAAFHLGGKESWGLWAKPKGSLNALAQGQLRTGPRRGYWPRSKDPRGEVWDTAYHQLSLLAYYRYSNHGFIR